MFDLKFRKPQGKAKKKAEDWFIREVNERIASERNFLSIIHGATGSGKSSLGLKICETFDPTFNISRVVFDPQEVFALIDDLPSKSWILVDEAGAILDARRFMTAVNCITSYVLETFRFKIINVIFTVPSIKMLDSNVRRLMHCMIYQTDRGTARIYKIASSWDGSIHALRVGTFVGVQMPSEKLWKQYEIKKQKAFNTLLRNVMGTLDGQSYLMKEVPNEFVSSSPDKTLNSDLYGMKGGLRDSTEKEVNGQNGV